MEDKGLSAMRQCYMDSWKSILRNLLNYSDKEIDAWLAATIRIRDLDDIDSWIYYEHSIHWMLNSCLRAAQIQGPLTDEDILDIQDGLDGAFNDAPKLDGTQPVVWDTYRTRINEALKPFGGALPVPERRKRPAYARDIHSIAGKDGDIATGVAIRH